MDLAFKSDAESRMELLTSVSFRSLPSDCARATCHCHRVWKFKLLLQLASTESGPHPAQYFHSSALSILNHNTPPISTLTAPIQLQHRN